MLVPVTGIEPAGRRVMSPTNAPAPGMASVGARVVARERSPGTCLAARLRMDITAGGEPAGTIPRAALDI